MVYVREGAGYRLRCPLDPDPQPGGQQGAVTWLRDCHEPPHPFPPGRSDPHPGLFLEFPTLGPEDQGNYTCLVRDTPNSFTVHLLVKGEFKQRCGRCCYQPQSRLLPCLTKRLWVELGNAMLLFVVLEWYCIVKWRYRLRIIFI